MPLTQTFGLGHYQRVVIVPETTYGQALAPTTANAACELSVLSCEMTGPGPAREPRTDSRASRSELNRITRRNDVTWSIESYLIPMTLTTPFQPYGPLVEAAMGTQAVGVFNLEEANVLPAVSIYRELPDVWLDVAKGCFVNEMTITCSGTDEPKITFSGMGSGNISSTGTSTTLNAELIGATSIEIETDDQFNFETSGSATDVGSIVQIGTSTNAGNGHLVTARTTNTLTISPGLISAQGAGVVVQPLLNTNITVVNDQPLTLSVGSVTLTEATIASGGITVPVVSFELNLNNNLKLVNNEFGSAVARDGLPGRRTVTGNMQVIMTSSLAKLWAFRKNSNFSLVEIEVQIGLALGNGLTINIPTAELDATPALEVPEEQEVIMNLSFMAFGAVGGDEFELEFTHV